MRNWFLIFGGLALMSKWGLLGYLWWYCLCGMDGLWFEMSWPISLENLHENQRICSECAIPTNLSSSKLQNYTHNIKLISRMGFMVSRFITITFDHISATEVLLNFRWNAQESSLDTKTVNEWMNNDPISIFLRRHQYV